MSAKSQRPSKSRWIKCISTHGNIRGVAIHAGGLVQAMADAHQLTPLGTQGLGECVIGALLVASYCKTGEKINLNIQGSGRYRQALVDAHPEGSVRGYVTERESPELLTRDDGEPFGPWGSGLLSVLRTKDAEGEQPYIGTVPLLTGHLAKDLSFYWAQSEQVPSAVGLAVNMDGNRVTAAGGFLVQAMPGANANEIRTIEKHIFELESLTKHLAQDAEPMSLLSQIFQSTSFVLLEEKPLEFKCNCSWDRVFRALALIGPAELRAILKEDDHASVRCDFCSKEYRVDSPKLEEMIARAGSAEASEP